MNLSGKFKVTKHVEAYLTADRHLPEQTLRALKSAVMLVLDPKRIRYRQMSLKLKRQQPKMKGQ